MGISDFCFLLGPSESDDNKLSSSDWDLLGPSDFPFLLGPSESDDDRQEGHVPQQEAEGE